MKLTIPTWLTLARIAMIPVLVIVYYLDYKWTNIAATAIFVFASITDWLDGWIARRYHQFSAFGAFLDPVADKLMVSTALVITVEHHHTVWMALWASVVAGCGDDGVDGDGFAQEVADVLVAVDAGGVEVVVPADGHFDSVEAGHHFVSLS